MRPVRLAAAFALVAGCAVIGTVLGPVPASADDVTLPGSMSTSAVNTTRFAIPVPAGVVPRAITSRSGSRKPDSLSPAALSRARA